GGTAANTFMATSSTNGADPNVANDNIITIKASAGVVGTEAKALVYTAGTLTYASSQAFPSKTVAASAVTDSAAPVVVSTTPANLAINVARSADLVINFSEPMNTSSLTFSTLPSKTYTKTWSNGNKTVNLSHSKYNT